MLMGALPGAGRPSAAPTINSLGVFTITPGVCTTGGGGNSTANPPASINITWSATGFDPSIHAYKLYENGIFKVAQLTTNYVKSLTGQVENGPFAQVNSDWTYRVDIVRVADNAVLASRSSDPWRKVYGKCFQPAVPT